MSARGGPQNRLAGESSPYLLLHASNPVDWHPWGDEAFERARREDKPVFLSVGYSTCYWCHVMERESFSDAALAQQLNEGFVSIKLDREERPELDEIYMLATQLLTHQGGWPNSVFLTHDRKPFFAGTYFPPEDRYGRPGFPRVLEALRKAWDERREDVLEQAESLAEGIRGHLAAQEAASGPPDAGVVAAVQAALDQRFDPQWGGFGGAPKFPSPSNLSFLLQRGEAGDARARELLSITLDRMARGGLQDQLAGGFHRYSTDARWLVPHFEKMLYDNAALARVYAHAAGLLDEPELARVARATLDFVAREMLSPEGAFLSAIDAETDGHEGLYYTWTRDELVAALAPADFELLAGVYGFGGAPNFEDSRYVLHLPRPWSELAAARGTSVEALLAALEPGRQALKALRDRRPRPLIDDKLMADWNGLMITAFAEAGRRLHEPRYGTLAAAAADFVIASLRSPSGELLHSYRAGQARIAAFLDDYAFLVQGLLALHETSAEPRWLESALRLQSEQDERLWDEAAGGYFQAGAHPELLVRAKSATDGAMASGNGTAALNLLALARLTGDGRFRERALRVFDAFGAAVEQFPLAHVTLVQALAQAGPGEAGAGAAPRLAPLEVQAKGLVEIHAQLEPAAAGARRRARLELHIAEGWHLNANPASQAGLIATSVGGPVHAVEYPAGDALLTGGGTLRVYRGRVALAVELQDPLPEPVELLVTFQPCDERRCLPAVTRRVTLVAPANA